MTYDIKLRKRTSPTFKKCPNCKDGKVRDKKTKKKTRHKCFRCGGKGILRRIEDENQ
jgi:uncharacterized protein (DUF983 family)